MNKELQKLAIVRACQWERRQEGANVWYEKDGKPVAHHNTLLNDLNAMHAALATLDDWKEGGDFENHLFRVLIRNKRARGVGHEGISTFDKIRACAADLAEAFLLTKNLWTPTGEENE